MTVKAPFLSPLVSGLPQAVAVPLQAAFRLLDGHNAQVGAELAGLGEAVKTVALFTEASPLTTSTPLPVELAGARQPLIAWAAVRDLAGSSWVSAAVTWAVAVRGGLNVLQISAIAAVPVAGHSYAVNLVYL